MSHPEFASQLSEYEFSRLVARALPDLLPSTRIVQEPLLNSKLRPDFLAYLEDGSTAIIEVRGQVPATGRRIAAVADQLSEYADAYARQHGMDSPIRRVLVIPGTFTAGAVEFLKTQGVDTVLDGVAVRAALDRQNGALDGPPPDVPSGLAEPEARQTASVRIEARALLLQLDQIPPGGEKWREYQRLCTSILEFLFCPPLERPIVESRNESGVNRRDIVFPNYTLFGFWAYMRETYAAHYIVVDAKNYTESVRKDEILQLANYLSRHGTGLFGVIVTRQAGAASAQVTRREQWFMHDKLIIELTDADLRQMIANKLADRDPTEVARQRIEDFRLGF